MASSVAAVIVAAGRGSRVGGELPKQYRVMAGEPVLRTTLSTFAWHGEIAAIQTVIHGDDRAHYDAAANGLKVLPPVVGGATRQISVRNGLEALSSVKWDRPDLILLDVMMPDMDGIEVCQRLQADEETKSIPVIFITARTTKEGKIEGLGVGAVDYITKPVDVAQLLSLMRVWLH